MSRRLLEYYLFPKEYPRDGEDGTSSTLSNFQLTMPLFPSHPPITPLVISKNFLLLGYNRELNIFKFNFFILFQANTFVYSSICTFPFYHATMGVTPPVEHQKNLGATLGAIIKI